MDTQAQRKALFRAKLRESAQKREKRIDSPLVRYNESDQPVCRVCNITLKSESNWPAHQASRKHHEAIENLKATAAGLTRGKDVNIEVTEPPAELQKQQSMSTLPADFFDKQDTKRQKTDMDAGIRIQSVSSSVESGLSDHPHGSKSVSTVVQSSKVLESSSKTAGLADVHLKDTIEQSETKSSNKIGQSLKKVDVLGIKQAKGVLPESFFDENIEKHESQASSQLSQSLRHLDGTEVKQVRGALPDGFFDSKERDDISQSSQWNQSSKRVDDVPAKQVKGALPEGFFDNKDADLRARGIEPVKIDINDAYKEFEKEIHDDLQEVDDRLEEEEIDAAEVREEFESLEQRAYREQVEMVKQKLLDVKAARLAKGQQHPAFMGEESSDESSSGGDDDDEEIFAVDWRAKHL